MCMPCTGSVGEGQPWWGMERAAHGQQRGKRVGGGVPLDNWARALSDYVQECIDSGIAPFPIGGYVHIPSAHGACMQSVLSMFQLLKMMFTRAPEGVVNYTKLCSVLEWLVGKWPELNSTSKAADQWAAALAQGIRSAMGHCRLMVQRPKKFEQRARFLSCEEKAKLKELLALYKQPKPGEVFVKSPDTEDSGGRVRQLGKVDSDDVFFSWPNGGGGSPAKKKANVQQAPVQKEATLQRQAKVEAQLTGHITASCLIEALSADPVNPALKQALQKKPASVVQRRPAKTNQQKEEAVTEEEQEEAEEKKGLEEEADEEEEAEEEEDAQEKEKEAEEEEEEADEREEGEEEEDAEGKKEAKEEAEETATARRVRLKWAMKRSYILEMDYEGIWRQVVEVRENQSENHKGIIRAIYNAMKQDMGFGKEQALAMRLDILQWH